MDLYALWSVAGLAKIRKEKMGKAEKKKGR